MTTRRGSRHDAILVSSEGENEWLRAVQSSVAGQTVLSLLLMTILTFAGAAASYERLAAIAIIIYRRMQSAVLLTRMWLIACYTQTICRSFVAMWFAPSGVTLWMTK
jgi:hypothetical protein